MADYILIVDDDNFISRVMTEVLTQASLTIQRAKDGNEALTMIYRQPPVLILLDVELPDKNGYEVLRVLRNDTRTSHLPIIMVTSRQSVEDRVKGLDSGADDYLSKPFAPEELVARVKSLLRRSSSERLHNPLTGLPGNKLIQEQMSTIARTADKSIIYVDIDNFKAYNDTYGFIRGDEVITLLAEILRQSLAKHEPDGFLGHIGGDDFILTAKKGAAKPVSDQIIAQFEKVITLAYDMEHRAQGYIMQKNRMGIPVKYSLMTLSIAILEVSKKGTSLHELSRMAAQVKHAAKATAGNTVCLQELA